MKAGFVLIEVLLASLISSIIGAALFGAFYQVNRAVRVVDDFVDVYAKAAILQHQLEKDLAGTCIPVEAVPAAPKDKNKKDKEEEDKEKKKEPKKPFAKLFYGVNRAGMFDMLTFITNNPLQVYWGAKAGKAKPKIARIVYRLVEDKEEKGSYTLMRQESYQLEFDKLERKAKEAKSYELVDGIKKMKLEYVLAIEKDKEKKEKKGEKEYRTFNEWVKEDLAEKKPEKEKKERRIPHGINITVSLWDGRKERFTEFIFKINLITDLDEEPQEKQKKQADTAEKSDKKEAKKSGTQSIAHGKQSLNKYSKQIKKTKIVQKDDKPQTLFAQIQVQYAP